MDESNPPSPLLLAECSTEIRCPAALACAEVADLGRFATWFPGVVRIRAADDAWPPRAWVETVRLPLRGEREVTIKVLASRPPVQITTEGRLPPLWPRMEIEVEPIDAGRCRVCWRMHSRSRRPLVRWLLVPLAGRVMRRRATRGLAALKARLEAGMT